MNYAKLLHYDAGNWDGIQTTIWFSGCTLKCKGCFNKVCQDFDYGMEYTERVEDRLIQYAKDDKVDGVCILGGEPFDQDLEILLRLVKRITNEVQKPIHLWTGYLVEDLMKDSLKKKILSYVSTVVDGPFILEKKDLTLKYRGSSNQRVWYGHKKEHQ